MDPVVNDAYRLRKLLEKATGLKVYKSELIANYFNGYLTRVRDKDCVKNRVKRAKIVRFTLC